MDLNPSGGGPLFVHYGSPVITAGSTILVPVTAADGSYQLRAFQGSNGAALYTLTSDYTAPANADWTPPSGPALALGTRAYYPGAGGTVYYRDLPNSANMALRPTSDIVALLVFTHQVRVMNLITHPENVDELAAALTFADEAPLPGPIRGDSRFAEEFAASGPLRDFDLRRTLMRYPCSYMIESDAFQALPAETKGAVYRRMKDLLREPNAGPFSRAAREYAIAVIEKISNRF